MADIFFGDETKPPNKTERRAVKRKRIRRLVNVNVDFDVPEEGCKRSRREQKKANICKVKRCSIVFFITCFLISLATAILLGSFFVGRELRGSFIANFINSYQEHYHQIVHGRKNYCVDKLDAVALTANIRQEQTILHQNKALLELQRAMEPLFGDNRRIFIAVVGPVGVGKTLYVNALQKNFPWQENVHSYVWNRFVRNNGEKYQNIRTFIENVSKCGVNLLIIKNLTPADRHLIDTTTEMLEEQPKAGQTRIIVIFVFNLNTMVSETEYSAEYNSLQKLNHTKSINFRSFGRKELEDCIQRESKLENMTLSHNTIQELLDTIDVKRSGCKNVNAKVLAFGKRIERPETIKMEKMSLTT